MCECRLSRHRVTMSRFDHWTLFDCRLAFATVSAFCKFLCRPRRAKEWVPRHLNENKNLQLQKKQSPCEEDVKEIETCGPSAIQTFPAPSITILEPRNTSAQMESLPTRDSRFQEKINALQMQSLHPTRATLVPTD